MKESVKTIAARLAVVAIMLLRHSMLLLLLGMDAFFTLFSAVVLITGAIENQMAGQ
jgi:hypothetical protein